MEDSAGSGKTGGRRDFPIGSWFRVRTHFANSRRLRRAEPLRFGGSQWHRTARGSLRVAQRGGRRLRSTSLHVPGHPCLPSRLRVPRGSLPGRAGPNAGRQGGRGGGEDQAGGWQPTYRLLLLDPRHAAAVTEPGSRAQRRGWRRWLPGSREGGIKRLLRHVALPLTGPLLLLLLPPHSSPPRRLRQQRPAPGTRQPPGRGSPPALRQLRSRTSLTDTRSALGPRSTPHLSPHFTSDKNLSDPRVYQVKGERI